MEKGEWRCVSLCGVCRYCVDIVRGGNICMISTQIRQDRVQGAGSWDGMIVKLLLCCLLSLCCLFAPDSNCQGCGGEDADCQEISPCIFAELGPQCEDCCHGPSAPPPCRCPCTRWCRCGCRTRGSPPPRRTSWRP